MDILFSVTVIKDSLKDSTNINPLNYTLFYSYKLRLFGSLVLHVEDSYDSAILLVGVYLSHVFLHLGEDEPVGSFLLVFVGFVLFFKTLFSYLTEHKQGKG